MSQYEEKYKTAKGELKKLHEQTNYWQQQVCEIR
jgi:hypothetical protein